MIISNDKCYFCKCSLLRDDLDLGNCKCFCHAIGRGRVQN